MNVIMCKQQRQQARLDKNRMVGQMTTGVPKVEDGAAGCTWYGQRIATISRHAAVYSNMV
jgi:hypothetical protein